MEIQLGVIYKITFPNGKCYIGQSIHHEERWKEHIKESEKELPDCIVHRAIKKYGVDVITFEVIERDIPQGVPLNDREIHWVAHYNCMKPNGYNMTPGGGQPSPDFIHKTEEQWTAIGQKLRKHKTYDLPKNIVELNQPKQNKYGFAVKVNKKKYEFSNPNQTMEEKLELAKACLAEVKATGKYERPNDGKKRKANTLNVPTYVQTYKGRNENIRVKVNKPGHPIKRFDDYTFTLEERIQQAIAHLNTLN